MPLAVPANVPLHTPLSDDPSSEEEGIKADSRTATATTTATATMAMKDALLARLPGYEFKNKSCKKHKKYLTLINPSEDDTDMSLNAHLLLSYQLLKPETDASFFISQVNIYDESTERDVCVSNVHKKAFELLCGKESLAQLKNCKNISLETWLLTGGGSEENGFQPVLHQILK